MNLHEILLLLVLAIFIIVVIFEALKRTGYLDKLIHSFKRTSNPTGLIENLEIKSDRTARYEELLTPFTLRLTPRREISNANVKVKLTYTKAETTSVYEEKELASKETFPARVTKEWIVNLEKPLNELTDHSGDLENEQYWTLVVELLVPEYDIFSREMEIIVR